jgi:NADP-dependent 3-hydroxy acid dehydrogenase YdfG
LTDQVRNHAYIYAHLSSFLTSIFLTCFTVATMVKLTTTTAANNAFIKKLPLTAVFVGATNGIGEFTVRELCKTHGHDGPGLRIIIVGRNERAAHTITNECRTICSASEFHFVQAGDISLLRSVDKACNEIREMLGSTKTPGIDILVQSQGRVQFGGRIGKVHYFVRAYV